MVKTTSDFIRAAKSLPTGGRGSWVGNPIIAQAFARYLEHGLNNGSIPDYDTFSAIFEALPQLFGDFWDDMVHDDTRDTVEFRGQFMAALQREPVDLLDIRGGSFRQSDVVNVDYLLTAILADESFRGKMEGYFFAPDWVLIQHLQRFMKKVYLDGLLTFFKTSRKRELLGIIGSIGVRVNHAVDDGGILISFARRPQNPGATQDESFTFMCKETGMQISQYPI